MESLTKWTPDGSDNKETCPVLDNPEPDCYCLSLSSLDVPRAVQFCLRDFKQCPTYKNYMGYPDYIQEEGCPVLDEPEPDCYYLYLNSFNIPKIVQFCLRDFRACPIFKKYMGSPES
jgi:hypothetical protein